MGMVIFCNQTIRIPFIVLIPSNGSSATITSTRWIILIDHSKENVVIRKQEALRLLRILSLDSNDNSIVYDMVPDKLPPLQSSSSLKSSQSF